MVIGAVKLEMHLFANITLLHDRWVTWLDGCGQLNLCNNLLKLVAIALTKVEIKFFKKNHLITLLLQIGAASLLRFEASVVINWANYNKSGQPLIQNREAITNWDNIYYNWGRYYKLGHNKYKSNLIVTKPSLKAWCHLQEEGLNLLLS